MDCREFERLIEDLVEGELRPPLAAQARAHAAACDSCRDLEELVRASVTAAPPPPDADLAAKVMATTSGSPCEGALERLSDLTDHTDGIESSLVQMHLDHCVSCSRVAETLVWLHQALPTMAEIEPDSKFTRDVIRATSGQRRPAWRDMLAHAIEMVSSRPRFPLEAAYAGAMILWLLFSIPSSPLGALAPRALELARANPVATLNESVRHASFGREVWDATGGRLAETTQTNKEAAAGRLRRVGQSAGALATHGTEAAGAALSGDFTDSMTRLKMMACDLESIWREMTTSETEKNANAQEA